MRAILGPLVVVAILAALWVFVIDKNPGDISDARYAKFTQLPAPKLLYSCTRKPTTAARTQKMRDCASSGRAGCEQEAYDWAEAKLDTTVDFASDDGTTSYENLLRDAKVHCARTIGDMGDGKFEVLKATKG